MLTLVVTFIYPDLPEVGYNGSRVPWENQMNTPTFKGIPLHEISGIQTFPEYCLLFKDDRPSQPISAEDAKLLEQMWRNYTNQRRLTVL